MADWTKRVDANVPGEFFVDTTCIDCDTCRQIAPDVFGEADGYSYVAHQPESDRSVRAATQALLSCPTGSIDTRHANAAKAVMKDFPLQIEGDVYYCGFNSPKSYGGNSYFIEHPEGNWLVDSPKYLPHLARQFESMGGIRYIFLTHRDDVADAAAYAKHFGSERIIHKKELSAQPEAERVIDGTEPTRIEEDFLIIPTPGHTAGHCVLLYRERYLFTGDHLWWDRDTRQLGASKTYNWYSWPEQKASLAKLMDYPFSWVLPGHGDRIHLPQTDMHLAMKHLMVRIGGHVSSTS